MTTPELTELQRIQDWITMRMTAGMPCDSCSVPLVDGELSQVARVETQLGILIFVVCERCSGAAGGPNLNSRLVTNKTVEFLTNHASSKGAGMIAIKDQLNGIPWEFCVLIAVAVRNPGKLSNWNDLKPEIERNKQLWLACGFVPTPSYELQSYLRSRSWPLSKCDSCGHPQCGEVPHSLWHTLRPGKLFDYGPEGFKFKFVCEWCIEKFFGDRCTNFPIGFCSPETDFHAPELNDCEPRVVIQ